MIDIIPLDFETNAVRIIMQDGEPWFVAADVCRVLEHSNIRVAISRWLDDDEKGATICDTPGGKQSLNIVSESGLYALIIRSRTPAAKRFRKWVTAEVLPTIPRTGSYSLPGRDGNDLAIKRARFEALPQGSRDKAEAKAAAVVHVQQLTADGMKVGEAVAIAAERFGISTRTIYNARNATYMVPRADFGPALMHKGCGLRGMQVECHPDVLRTFCQLRETGARFTDCYHRTVEIAEERGWSPIPAIYNLRRAAKRLLAGDQAIHQKGAA
ncbi:MAG: BRO family protein [Paracoccus sp. (in: a-proteobacteria)]